jgi:hypothetical protein
MATDADNRNTNAIIVLADHGSIRTLNRQRRRASR